MALFSGSISPWFVLSNNLATTNTRAILALFLALFSRRQLRLFNFTGHWPLATDQHSPVPRPTPGPAGSGRAQTLRRWLLPDTDSRTGKTERSPISTSTPFLSVWHQTGRSLRKNPSVFPRSPPLDRRPFFRGRRRSTPVAPRNSQTPVRRPSQVTGVRPETAAPTRRPRHPTSRREKPGKLRFNRPQWSMVRSDVSLFLGSTTGLVSLPCKVST